MMVTPFTAFHSARTEDDHLMFETELHQFIESPEAPYASIIQRIQSANPDLTAWKIVHLALNLHAAIVEINGNGFGAMGKSYVDRAKEGLELVEPLLALGMLTHTRSTSSAYTREMA
jgi:hypothetical protein